MSRITAAELNRLRSRIGSSVNPRDAPDLTKVTASGSGRVVFKL